MLPWLAYKVNYCFSIMICSLIQYENQVNCSSIITVQVTGSQMTNKFNKLLLQSNHFYRTHTLESYVNLVKTESQIILAYST